MDQPNYTTHQEPGLTTGGEPTSDPNIWRARTVVPVIHASDFDIRKAAMGFAIDLNQCSDIEDHIEIAQTIEHYLRFGDYKEPPTATEELPLCQESGE